MDREPTHHLSREFQDKLTEAKNWYDERGALEEAIGAYGGIAERNQEDRDALDRYGASLLAEIIEMVDQEWGFATPLPRAAP